MHHTRAFIRFERGNGREHAGTPLRALSKRVLQYQQPQTGKVLKARGAGLYSFVIRLENAIADNGEISWDN